MTLPQLLKFGLVFRGRGPYAVLNGLVHIVIVRRANNQAELVVVVGGVLVVDVLQVWKRLDDRVEILEISDL